MKRTIWRCAIAALCASLGTGALAETLEVGFVESFEGEPTDYALVRDGAPVEVRLFGVLHEGDEVQVQAEEGRIQLQIDGAPVELSAADGAHVVSGAEITTPTRNVVSWLRGLVTGRGAADAEAAVGDGISLVTRGSGMGPLRAPLLPAEGASLEAGARTFRLAWAGGMAPYRAALIDGNGAVVWQVGGLMEPRLAIGPNVYLVAGSYRLELADAGGEKLGAPISVGPPAEAPPDELAGADPLSQVLSAAWFAQREDRGWVLEAYQRAAAIDAAYQPADALRQALERGERP